MSNFNPPFTSEKLPTRSKRSISSSTDTLFTLPRNFQYRGEDSRPSQPPPPPPVSPRRETRPPFPGATRLQPKSQQTYTLPESSSSSLQTLPESRAHRVVSESRAHHILSESRANILNETRSQQELRSLYHGGGEGRVESRAQLLARTRHDHGRVNHSSGDHGRGDHGRGDQGKIDHGRGDLGMEDQGRGDLHQPTQARQRRHQDHDTSDYDHIPSAAGSGETEARLRNFDHVIQNLEEKTNSLSKMYRDLEEDTRTNSRDIGNLQESLVKVASARDAHNTVNRLGGEANSLISELRQTQRTVVKCLSEAEQARKDYDELKKMTESILHQLQQCQLKNPSGVGMPGLAGGIPGMHMTSRLMTPGTSGSDDEEKDDRIM
jgi:hypothetical protein